MSLPFLKNKDKSVAGLIIQHRAPDAHEDQEPSDSDGLESCVQDLCQAIESKDYKAGAQALRAAFEIMEAQPHEEADHSFDAQNEKAAE